MRLFNECLQPGLYRGRGKVATNCHQLYHRHATYLEACSSEWVAFYYYYYATYHCCQLKSSGIHNPLQRPMGHHQSVSCTWARPLQTNCLNMYHPETIDCMWQRSTLTTLYKEGEMHSGMRKPSLAWIQTGSKKMCWILPVVMYFSQYFSGFNGFWWWYII